MVLFVWCSVGILGDFGWNKNDADRNLKLGGGSGASRSLIWGPFMKQSIIHFCHMLYPYISIIIPDTYMCIYIYIYIWIHIDIYIL